MKKFIAVVIFFLSCSFSGQQRDELYQNYVAALENGSTFQYYLVATVKNLNTGETREYCTQGLNLDVALHRELKIDYSKEGCSEVEKMAIENHRRYFEFKNDSALWDIGGVWEYSTKDLSELENQVNFDSLAHEIRKAGHWSKEIHDDKRLLMYAHALFNRGILTGESNCFGGTLEYVDLTK